eukprot:109477_1
MMMGGMGGMGGMGMGGMGGMGMSGMGMMNPMMMGGMGGMGGMGMNHPMNSMMGGMGMGMNPMMGGMRGMGGMGGMGMGMNSMMGGMGMNPMMGNRVIVHHHIGDDGSETDSVSNSGLASGSPPSSSMLQGVGQYIGRVGGKDYYRLPSIKPPNMSPFVWNELIKYSANPQQVKIIPSKDLINWRPQRSAPNGAVILNNNPPPPPPNLANPQLAQAKLARNSLMNKNMENENALMQQNMQLTQKLLASQQKNGRTPGQVGTNPSITAARAATTNTFNSAANTRNNAQSESIPRYTNYNVNLPWSKGKFGTMPLDNGRYGGGFGIIGTNGKGWTIPDSQKLAQKYPWAVSQNQQPGSYTGAVAKGSSARYNDYGSYLAPNLAGVNGMTPMGRGSFGNNLGMDSTLQLQQEAATPGSLAVMQSQQAIQKQLKKINNQEKSILKKKGEYGKPGKMGYKYLGPFGPRLGKREGLIATMMRHMDQMAANMHAVANHLHRINTGNVHGFGPIPLNRKERKALGPTLKAYMKGTVLPGTKRFAQKLAGARRRGSRGSVTPGTIPSGSSRRSGGRGYDDVAAAKSSFDHYGDLDNVPFDVYTKSFGAHAQDNTMYDTDEEEEEGYLEIDQEANTEFDDEWESNAVIWDEISEFMTTDGERIGQKCLHMWGERLCLCQFLGWMDSSKYQCRQKRFTVTRVAAPQTKKKKKNIEEVRDTINTQQIRKGEIDITALPKKQPKWMPGWMWKKLQTYKTTTRVSAAMIESDLNQLENAEDNLFDDNGEEWIISNEAIASEYESKWNNDEIWDDIQHGMVTTKNGNRISRKCLHMWGQRLCLCQFLDWIDSSKYQCVRNAPYTAPVAAKREVENTIYDDDDDDIDGHLEINEFATKEFDDEWDNDDE